MTGEELVDISGLLSDLNNAVYYRGFDVMGSVTVENSEGIVGYLFRDEGEWAYWPTDPNGD